MTINIHNQQSGITLIELIVYVGLAALFLSGVIVFGWNIIFGSHKSAVQREVNQNLRLSAKRIMYEVKNASALNSISGSSVCLASATPARNPTRIYLASGRLRIAWGGGTSDCTAMTNDQPLTSNQVTVSDLQFINRSSGTSSYAVDFLITVQSVGDVQEWQKIESYAGSAVMRSN